MRSLMYTFALSAADPHGVTPPSLQRRVQHAPGPGLEQPPPTSGPNLLDVETNYVTPSAETMPMRFRADSDPATPERFAYD